MPIFSRIFIVDNANIFAFGSKKAAFVDLFVQMLGDSFPSGNAPL
jgi:hypothetical protein